VEEIIRDETPESYEQLRRLTTTPFAIGEECALGDQDRPAPTYGAAWPAHCLDWHFCDFIYGALLFSAVFWGHISLGAPCSGRRFASKWQFLPYIERGILEYARLDIANVGGFTEAMKVCPLPLISPPHRG
jgi:hypothetical protein